MVCDWLWDYFSFRSLLLSKIAMKKKIRRLCAILAVLLIMVLLVIGIRKYAHEQFLASFEILTREEMEAQLVDLPSEHVHGARKLDDGTVYAFERKKYKFTHPTAGHVVIVYSTNSATPREIVGYYYVDAEIFYQEIYVNGEFLMYGIQQGIVLEAAP